MSTWSTGGGGQRIASGPGSAYRRRLIRLRLNCVIMAIRRQFTDDHFTAVTSDHDLVYDPPHEQFAPPPCGHQCFG
jgi:hypothetical protein